MAYISARNYNEEQYDQIVQYLLSQVIKPKNRDFARAVSSNYFNAANLMIQKGVDIDYRETWGRTDANDEFIPTTKNWTLLIYAAARGETARVKYLVEKGAKINLRDDDGYTAASLAYDKVEIEIYNYLKEHGAIDFEPKQIVQQPVQTAPVTNNTYNYSSPSSSSSSSSTASRPADTAGWSLGATAGQNSIYGTWNSSIGTGNFMMLNRTGTSGDVTLMSNGKRSSGTVSISGNILNIYIASGQFSGQRFAYRIVTNKLIQGDGENFSRY